jgi:precorrin-6A/cobalt-precorrin-6A reductase
LQENFRLLILGGTSEASALAARLRGRNDIAATVSLAGRTRNPVLPGLPTRIGGFGGVDGLRVYLREGSIGAVIDATHPFAAQMSRHAAEACAAEGIPLVCFTRPAWERAAGDIWIDVATIEAAVAALGDAPKRVLLTQGRLRIGAFAKAPQHHYLVRAIEPPQTLDALPHSRLIIARGPFGLAQEAALMRDEKIEIVVSKNSGGLATYAKIEAARRFRIPIVMLARPAPPEIERTHDLDDAFAWIKAHAAHGSRP